MNVSVVVLISVEVGIQFIFVAVVLGVALFYFLFCTSHAVTVLAMLYLPTAHYVNEECSANEKTETQNLSLQDQVG